MTSFTSSSRTTQAWIWAIAILIAVNAWVAWQLHRVAASPALDECMILQNRIARFPDKQAVQVVIFGNSHALAGLRPPDVAQALGLPKNAVFSFALPSGTPEEMRVLATRYLPSFPNAHLALSGMDESYMLPPLEYRMRYWTRFDLPARLHFALQAPTLEGKVARMAGWFVPVADFVTPLQTFLSGNKRIALHNLFRSPVPTTYYANLQAMHYPWGLPPPWDRPSNAHMWRNKARFQRPQAFRERAASFMHDEGRTPQGLADLKQLASTLEAQHCRLVLVGLPYPTALSSILKTRYRSPLADYQRRFHLFLDQTHMRMIAAPTGWQDRWFYDTDHLDPAGARRFANWLAARLKLAEPAGPPATPL